jgi:hypothetical protein
MLPLCIQSIVLLHGFSTLKWCRIPFSFDVHQASPVFDAGVTSSDETL